MEFPELKDDVMRKIGRNVLLFQEMETLLKHIVIRSNFSVSHIGDFEGYREKFLKAIKDAEHYFEKKSLGQVIGYFVKNTYSKVEDTANSSSDRDDEWTVSLKIRIQSDQEKFDAIKENWAELAEQRNNLVHHFLEDIEPDGHADSHESWLEAGKRLDRQRDTIVSENEQLRTLVSALQSAALESLKAVRAQL